MQQDYKNYDFKRIEEEVKEYWDTNQIYKKTEELKSKGENFYFNDGPPYTSGAIHMGTAYNKIIKDFVLRYLRMKGYNVRDQPGYDMHGLPIEVQVEKALGIKNKKEIEDFGVEKFIEKCRAFAIEHERKMTDEFKALGVWMDWDSPYETIKNSYIGRAWWLIKKASEKNLLERALRLINWCPRCETALADAEIEYRDREDDSIYVKMRLRDGRFIIIWTTTPWTLPANMAIAYNPDFVYDEILVENKESKETERWILLNAESVVEDSGYRIKEYLSKIKGSELEGLEYVPPLNIRQEKTRKILPADYVTAENTGFVHTAPGHGAEDFDLGLRFGLEVFCPVDESGTFTEEAGKYAGKRVFEANRDIIEDLGSSGFLVKSEKITHRYGFCWRCKTPIIYRATEQWFLRVEDENIKEKMIEEVKRVKWYPDWAGSARELEWVKGARNWCISRQRYWGIPLPIWICSSCKRERVIGSEEELRALGYNKEELHRPWIDSLEIKCDCGGKMHRIKDVQDVWLDSGVCSWAELKDEEFDYFFPPKLIIEAHDQTRGWFYSQLGAGVIGFNRAPYDEVMMHGWIFSESGEKMSKSLGNVIAPLEMAEKYGIDSLRFYLLSSSAPWEDKSFMIDGIKNANRTMNILWNAQNFAISYMLLDSFDPERTDYALEKEDLWLASRVESLKERINGYMKEYELHRVCRDIEQFMTEDLSRFYIKVIRKRVWIEEKSRSKNGAYKTLYEALLEISKLLAPVAPHIAERLYRNLEGAMESVHMENWPGIMEEKINLKLEESMDIAREIIEAALSVRQSLSIKVRQPLKRIIIETEDENAIEAIEDLKSIIKDQINVKKIEVQKGNEDMPACDFSKGKLYIDTEVDYEIRAETIARELIRRVQEMRKRMNLNIEDYIKCTMELPESFVKSFEDKKEDIAKETRAREMVLGKSEGFVQEWKIDGERVVIGINKL
ncbi:MAG: isoleucine--tRNA ligase [Candidatus Thermoplasmatota archaeon]|nr:isoleucine--tRNA ligase [Candidatus Thermoplasmatota archaeon]